MEIQDEYRTRDGGRILVSPPAKLHLAAHPEVGAVIEEAVSRIKLPSDRTEIWTEIEMSRIVGVSGCVEARRIRETDLTTFAWRKERKHPSRVAVGAEGRPVSTVVVRALPTANLWIYLLATAYVGTKAPLEPWDPELKTAQEKDESLDFWCTHALVYNHAVMGLPFQFSWYEILCRTD